MGPTTSDCCCYDALCDWKEPRDTLQLCQHVLAHGTTTWEQLGARLGCPAALCALRWHVLWLEQFSATSAVKPQKVYSDWERCVLYTALQPSLHLDQNKRTRFQALTKWLPGRSATGLKQAHIAHVQGNEAKAAALLKAQGWPRDLTGLLAAWPGPLPQLEGRVSEGVQAAAHAIIAATGSTSAATSLQKLGPSLRRHLMSSTTSACMAEADSSCPAPHNKARRLQLAQRSPTSHLHMQQQPSAALSEATWSGQQQQYEQQQQQQYQQEQQQPQQTQYQQQYQQQPQQQMQMLWHAAGAAEAAPDFEQILYDTIHEMLGTANSPLAGRNDSGGSSSSSSLAAAPVPEGMPSLQQLLQPSAVQGLGTGTATQLLAAECFETKQPASPDGDPSVVSLRSMQGSSKGLAAHGSFQQDPTQLPPSPCSGHGAEQDSQDAIELELQKFGCLPTVSSRTNCHDTRMQPVQHSWQQQEAASDATVRQLVTVLQHRVGQLEEQQAVLLCRIDQLQDCLQQAQHNGEAGLH